MERLSARTLGTLPRGVSVPTYDRSAVEIGIVHLGLGAFHRSHQATYTEDVISKEMGPWGICGVDLLGPEIRDRLASQDYLYTYLEQGPVEHKPRIVGILRDVLVGPENPAAVIDRLVHPGTKIASITVTEKGYCHDPATGNLNQDHPGIQHDLRNPKAPKTVIGVLVAALDRRRLGGAKPFTVLSCDNLPSNGKTVEKVVKGFAGLLNKDLLSWIEDEVAFPCTMVDRIVPATTPENIAEVAKLIGLSDEAPTVGEPFRQWAIEDRFTQGRPNWERAGAELVSDVEPFEEMKLRLLNGSHSTLAYLGYLGGYQHIDETMGNPAYKKFVRAMMDQETTPAVDIPAGVDIEAYKDSLIDRFSNPSVKHRTWQIAMDGSQKLPQRYLNTVRHRLAAGQVPQRIALSIAAWMRYVTAIDENGQSIDVRDPLADRFKAIAAQVGSDTDGLADGLLAVREVFGDELPKVEPLRAAIKAALKTLYAEGAKGAVEAYLG